MTAAVHVHRDDHASWPLERRDGFVLAGWFVALVAVWWAVGALLTGPLDGSGFVAADEDVSRWFAERRTPLQDDLANAGSLLSDTLVKIVVTAIIVAVVMAVWRSWRDAVMIVLPLVLEASTFIVATWLVGRPRPDVPRLEESPVDSSWPSGHVAAATAYAAIAVVVFWRVENKVVRAITVVLVIAVPVIVGWARTYAGMHHLTDVVSGAVLGAVCVVVVHRMLRTRT